MKLLAFLFVSVVGTSTFASAIEATGGSYGRNLSAKHTHSVVFGEHVCFYTGGASLGCRDFGRESSGANSWADDMNDVFDAYPDSVFSFGSNSYGDMVITKFPKYDPESNLPVEEQPGYETY